MLLCLLFCSCKPLGESESSRPLKIVPKRTANNPKVPSNKWGVVEFDGKGALLNSLVISLDYLNGSPHSGTKPKCMMPLSGGILLAEVRCFKGSNQVAGLTVSHVRQECYTNPGAEKISPIKEFSIPGCQKAAVYGFDFEPVIRVDIE